MPRHPPPHQVTHLSSSASRQALWDCIDCTLTTTAKPEVLLGCAQAASRPPSRPHQVKQVPLPQSPTRPCPACLRDLLCALRACPPCQLGLPSLLMALVLLVCLSFSTPAISYKMPSCIAMPYLRMTMGCCVHMAGSTRCLSFSMCGSASNTWLALTVCTPHCVGAAPQSSSSAGPSLPPRKAKPEEQSGASGTRVPVSGAQSQTRQQGVAASTPQGNGLPNGTSPSAPSTTGNGPAHGGPVSAARTAGTVSSGGAGGNSSGGAHLSRTSL